MECPLVSTMREHVVHTEARLREPSLECVPGETNAEPDALTREDFLCEGRTLCRDGLGVKRPARAQPRAKGRVRLRERESW